MYNNKFSSLFPDKIKCKCIKDYLFNNTDRFKGITFTKSHYYRFSRPDIRHKDSKLVAVVKDETQEWVGMDIDRFNKHFVVILDSSDIENKKICEEYKINFIIE